MELLAHTRIVLWEGGSLWVVDATPVTTPEPRSTEPHAHHAIQVTIGLGGTFRLATGGIEVRGEAVAVAPDVTHVFEAEGLVAIVFVEPESRTGRAIFRALFDGRDLAPVPSEMLADFGGRIAANFRDPEGKNDALVQLGRGLAASMAGSTAASEPDPRVRKMIAWAAGQLDGPVSLADVGAIGGLSAHRLRHLFVEQTGLAFRTYLLWLRLTRALERLAAGASLTQSAHEAGFADSSHFSRTFKRMFGVAPATLRIT
ncbi:AraC family transcriptional regulator [Phenylobacterium sp.]|uniref:helix-turn-helix transcriptional regulator n=1 Tax=Phenylobacterium sp. TaxID=1871053 RepID=UPI00286E90C3|nr:AraC family transcriptional regulator [Phenylobacterium sp.]